jgi:2,3-bisphosphoglycerate-independent phosphoglycerate mutase
MFFNPQSAIEAIRNQSMPRVLLIFVDGVGIGRRDPGVNPFARFEPAIFAQFATDPPKKIHGSGFMTSTDATLGVAGLPQSATGQTTILTGVNASKFLGSHLSGFPNAALKDLLARESIFVKLQDLGRSVTFANSYTPGFFNRKQRPISVTTAACYSAGVRLRTLEDLANGNAVYQDFTHRYLRQIGYDLPLRTPQQSGANLARIASRYSFTLYEYFITDLVGHACDMALAVEVLENLERFICSVLEEIDPVEQLVLLTSDHGNIEDLSRKTHTLNRVPTITWGHRAGEAPERISSIEAITPFILSFLV